MVSQTVFTAALYVNVSVNKWQVSERGSLRKGEKKDDREQNMVFLLGIYGNFPLVLGGITIILYVQFCDLFLLRSGI